MQIMESDSIPLFFNEEFPENQLNVLLINEDSKEKNIVSFYNPTFADDVSFGMHNLIIELKKIGHPMQCCMIFWFNLERNHYIYIGNDPIPLDLYIYFSVVAMSKVVLKYRKPHFSNILNDTLKEQTLKDASFESNLKESTGRRSNERKIGTVLEKVALWRKLFSGITVQGIDVQMSLKGAAKKVGLSKKTLDDYFMQIRMGRRFGFNFNEHHEEKMGVLRKFNRNKMSEKEEAPYE